LVTVPHAKTGRVRMIAVSSARRPAVMPDVATVAETYPGYDFITWVGVFVPAGTSQAIVGKLHGDLVKALQRTEVRERLESLGNEIIAGSGDQLGARVRDELALYGKS
jgi:tripartite-type tricarboxylate transporter receptor subunit TctC